MLDQGHSDVCVCVFAKESTRKEKNKDRQDGEGEAKQGAFQSFEHRRKWKRFNFGASASYVQVCVWV